MQDELIDFAGDVADRRITHHKVMDNGDCAVSMLTVFDNFPPRTQLMANTASGIAFIANGYPATYEEPGESAVRGIAMTFKVSNPEVLNETFAEHGYYIKPNDCLTVWRDGQDIGRLWAFIDVDEGGGLAKHVVFKPFEEEVNRRETE